MTVQLADLNRFGARTIWLGMVLALGVSTLPLPAKSPPPTGMDSAVEVLLGNNRRAQFAATLPLRRFNGKAFAWAQYSAWGKQLVIDGCVKDPPYGQAPSVPLSDQYRCIHCHNLTREDVKLTVQDPAGREKLIRAAAAEPDKRDGSGLAMTTGTTFWGIVNRERYYNGHYTRYTRLKVADGSRMKPESLADAIQVCCNYCSVGRYPEGWELDAMLAYFWDLELRLKDLDLPGTTAQQILDELNRGDPAATARARGTLRQSYLRFAGALSGDEPRRSVGLSDQYADGSLFTGNPQRGKLLYASACAGCHGDIHGTAGPALARTDSRFYKYVWHGTERAGLYMPLFTLERLNRQQAADIRAHLQASADAEP